MNGHKPERLAAVCLEALSWPKPLGDLSGFRETLWTKRHEMSMGRSWFWWACGQRPVEIPVAVFNEIWRKTV